MADAEMAGRTTKEGVLYIGMDLGCYKTSVAATNDPKTADDNLSSFTIK